MDFLKDRRIILAGGGALALLAGLGIAVALMTGHDKKPDEAPPASRAGLIVETGRDDDSKLDPARPLRCFVGGTFVGEITLAECAKKNGVATGALDVGVDETGALAAADQAGTVLTPLPPTPTVSAPAATTPSNPSAPTTPASASANAPLGACWRYAGNEWRRLPGEITLNACAQQLFNGRCERTGGATYGRWGEETLRLVPGRIEISSDNRSFHTAFDQGPNCSVPSAG
ncbi:MULTISPECIES: hypothetical protein [unclassified Caulobacter]|uniref:hypothetical protein n=1 Tax=unclassified Caulobacter TaxID=2648921 RepID=UPI0006FB4466|nr:MULTISPECIES: hypothetical protein [unclassified Caulobacter]KQV57449.1 hypothetical protein ASC62_14470 [Caulobacter sp. Root342]KQV67021.1 hypothetical protein ASC70_14570 [Caulobacter sp. Root343]